MTSHELTPRRHDVMPSHEIYDLGAQPHHRPPHIEYRDGVPYHYTVGQPPQQVVVRLPEHDTGGLSPWVRDASVLIAVLCVVMVLGTGCTVSVVVLCGGTLMGIIGAVSAAALPVTVSAVALAGVLAWAVVRARAAGRTDDDNPTPAGRSAGRGGRWLPW